MVSTKQLTSGLLMSQSHRNHPAAGPSISLPSRETDIAKGPAIL